MAHTCPFYKQLLTILTKPNSQPQQPDSILSLAASAPNISWSRAIISWYRSHKRDLPWRDVNNAYFTWLSEVILQQTRIDQGTAYYHRFIETYPTITNLASASEQDVLRLWQGLGYYSRARALHATARQVVTDHGGQMPLDYDLLLGLKGIGPYTAAAIASIAGGQDVVTIDGNVYRVLARCFGISQDIAASQARGLFQAFGQQLLPAGQASDFNQGMMDLGATICTPNKPNCPACPVAVDCFARQNQKIEALPVKNIKIKQQVRYLHYVAITADGVGLWLRMRDGKGIWHGLWELPVLETAKDMDWKELSDVAETTIPAGQENLWSLLLPNLPIRKWLAPKHQLTHQTILANFYILDIAKSVDLEPLTHFLTNLGYQYLDQAALEAVPKPVLLSKFLASVSIASW